VRIVNFAHGALYMLGRLHRLRAREKFGLGFWASLAIAPLSWPVRELLERTMIRRLYDLPASYNLRSPSG